MSIPNDDFTTKAGFIARGRKAVTAFVTGFAGGAAASLTAALPDGITVDEYVQAGWSALGLGVIAGLLVWAVRNAE